MPVRARRLKSCVSPEAMETVYRALLTVSMYLAAVSSAPQDSAVTYVQPLSEDSPSQPRQLRESRIENLPLTIGAINVENPTEPTNQSSTTVNDQSNNTNYQRYTRDNEFTTSYETTEVTEATDKGEEIATTEINEVKPKFPSPRYISKLSYFKKSEDYEGSALRNFLERTGKRKFRSRCRCEKIWNCPKLQITVPRCPDEYFLCCF